MAVSRKSSIRTFTRNTLTLIFFPFPSAPVLSVVINSTSEMCFSGSADSTIICWSIPSLDIDPYGPYRKFLKYSYLFIYLFFMSLIISFLSFFGILLGYTCCHVFQPLAKAVVGHLMEGREGMGVTNVKFFL